MQYTHKIAVIDSGAGGISILGEIIKQIDNLRCIYIADHQRFPYGELSENDLLSRLTTIVKHLIKHYQPSIIVVACNTASTLALTHLRHMFDVNFVGVVPAIKPANALSSSKHIGILATPATVSRSYTHNLSKQFAHTSTVSYHGTTELVRLAENYLLSGVISQACVDAEVYELLEQDAHIDVVVLACTHFPLLKSQIQHAVDKWPPNKQKMNIKIIDSGEAVARRVKSLLCDSNQTWRAHKNTIQETPTVNIEYLSTSNTQTRLIHTREAYNTYIKNIAHTDIDAHITLLNL